MKFYTSPHVAWLTGLFILSFTLLILPAPSIASSGDQARTIPDTPVLDQNGMSRLFYTDLVRDKIVAVNFVFTRCTMVCPMLGFKFGQLRELLGAQAGESIHLVSISTDPLYDTPERLNAWAQKFNAGPGWNQVTGNKQDIDHLLKSLKAFSADKQDHSSLVLLINDSLNEWLWLDGESDPKLIHSALAQWLNPALDGNSPEK